MCDLKVTVEEVPSGFIVTVLEIARDAATKEPMANCWTQLNQDIGPTYKKAVVTAKRLLGDILTERLQQTEEEKTP